MAKSSIKIIKIIKTGTLTVEAGEAFSAGTINMKHSLGIGGGSSVIYIENDDRKIIVDTGFEYESDMSDANRTLNLKTLEIALALKGIVPGDIDAVFITHWHRDHFGNASIFKRAQLMASRLVAEKFVNEEITPVDDNIEIADGVRTLYTPGHTRGHCSILVQGDVNIAIAGDVIVDLNYFDKGKLWDHNSNFFDHEAGMKSMKMLARSSDMIIPGHGTPFSSYEPLWMNG